MSSFFKKSSFQKMVLLGALLLGGISNDSVWAMERTEETTGEEEGRHISHFEGTPPELLELIGSSLDLKSIARVELTSKSMKENVFPHLFRGFFDVNKNQKRYLFMKPIGAQKEIQRTRWELEYGDSSRPLKIRLNNLTKDNIQNFLIPCYKVSHLDLSRNKVDEEIARALAGGGLTHLVSLNLALSGISTAGIKIIAEGLKGLTSLDLSQNKIGLEGFKALENLTGLKSLRLLNCEVTKENSTFLSVLTNLTSLNLTGNEIGAGAAFLKNLKALQVLKLGGDRIGDEGVKFLTELEELTSLVLAGNSINHAGMETLSGGNFPQLTFLSIGSNKGIYGKGLKALTKGGFPALISLDLRFSDIGDEEVRIIAEHFVGLESLDLWMNKITDEGAKVLAGGDFSALTSLNLKENQIKDEGRKAIQARFPFVEV